MTARRFGFDIELATTVGGDFPDEYRNLLSNNSIFLKQSSFSQNSQTTRFRLEVEGYSRKLFIESRCTPIPLEQVQNVDVDCWLVSPVLDEVPTETLEAITKEREKKEKKKKKKGNGRFVLLDPQGYTRRIMTNPQGDSCISFVDRLDIDLTGISALKVDSAELAMITGGLQGIEGMLALQKRGVEFILATENRVVHLLHKDMHYWIKINEIDTPDSTGAGDILCAAFACGYIKEKDPLWAVCFGAGALRASLETKEPGLTKIPNMNKIESSASYFYNTVSFKRL
jgi:sugar/nucleoside kinase (ribokinase family)